MKYGYARVSSEQQNLDRQLVEMAEQGIAPENIFKEKKSGKDFDREEYNRLLETVKEGDIIYILSIDRLGRNYDEILKQWQYITKELKVDICVLDMPLLNTAAKNEDLTGKFVADLVLQILSYVAQKERESIKRRQSEGIKIARVDGKFRQMQATDEEFFAMKELVDKGEVTVAEACRRLGIKSRITWYNRLKIYAKDGKL